jgi:preprotein translocase subunit SecF
LESTVSDLPDVKAEEQAADIGPNGAEVEVEEEEEEEEEKPQKATVAVPAAPAIAAEPKPSRRLNIIGRRNLFFAISLIVIIPGILSMWHNHFLLGIDFAGGTELTVTFGNHPTLAQVQGAVNAEGVNGSVIQTNKGDYIIRYPVLNENQLNTVQADLAQRLGPTNVDQILSVGGTIAGETIALSLLAVGVAAAAILLLLAIRFRNVPGGWRAGFQFGGSALAALLHDVFVLTGLYSIFGTVFHWQVGEINAYFVTAVLTVVGFSVHDTIVVFDRIRENLRVSQRLSFEQVVNLSIMQTAARSIITSFTVVLVLAAIFISAGPTLQGLALALLIGIVSGTYSSIFNAAPLLVVWRRLQPLR